jgi:hypothetical protein
MPDNYFRGSMAKLRIASVEPATELWVEAQYNPKELSVTQPIGWTEHDNLKGQGATEVLMEFGAVKAQTMQIELLFDGVETNGIAGRFSVMQNIRGLQELAAVRDPHASDEELRRPHFCVVTWGTSVASAMPPFRCVIESLTTKYLVFSANGDVLRATCTIGVKEADRVRMVRATERQPSRVTLPKPAPGA